ncbi:MAG: hypothetical protein HYS12_01300 [Planctomycetes bacterium]|nr:hypothetical protein [Planctomycetota bacterium]
MNRLLRWALLPLSALLIAPAFAADDKKDDPKTPPKVSEKKNDPKLPPPKVPEKKEAENKFIKAGEIAGELVHVEPSKNSFRVKVTIPYSEFNQGAYRGLLQAQIDLRNARDVNAVYNARRAIAQHQNNLYTVKSVSKELPVDAAEDCKVRMAQPKATFDDMGNVKKLSVKELAALRGNTLQNRGVHTPRSPAPRG